MIYHFLKLQYSEVMLPNATSDNGDAVDVIDFYGPAQVWVFSIAVVVSFFSAGIILVLCGTRLLKIDTLSTTFLGALTVTNLILLIHTILCVIKVSVMGVTNHVCSFSAFCVASSYIYSLTNMSSLFWTLIMGACCSVQLVTVFSYNSLNKKRFIMIFVANLGIPVVIVTIALIKGALGWTDTHLNNGWCWISTCNTTLSVEQQWVWMLLTNKLWEMLCAVFIVNIIFMGYCVRQRKMSTTIAFPWARARRSEDSEFETTITIPVRPPSLVASIISQGVPQKKAYETLNSSRLFLWIPVLLIVSRIGGMIRFFMDSYLMFDPHADRSGFLRANSFFEFYQAVGDVSQPTFNLGLVLILRDEARTALKASWSRLRQLTKQQAKNKEEEEDEVQAPEEEIEATRHTSVTFEK